MPTASQTVTVRREHSTTPVTVVVTAITVERKEEPDLLGGLRRGLYAQFDVTIPPHTRPCSYLLSRLIAETEWVVDALFGSNGYPHFCHGFGARYLRLRGIAPELADVLDQEARSRGLVQAIGQDVPLILPRTPPHPPPTPAIRRSCT